MIQATIISGARTFFSTIQNVELVGVEVHRERFRDVESSRIPPLPVEPGPEPDHDRARPVPLVRVVHPLDDPP